MRKAEANDRPKPIHAVFHSHILRRHIKALGVLGDAVGPGMKSKEIAAVMTPGATRTTTMSTPTVTVSSW